MFSPASYQARKVFSNVAVSGVTAEMASRRWYACSMAACTSVRACSGVICDQAGYSAVRKKGCCCAVKAGAACSAAVVAVALIGANPNRSKGRSTSVFTGKAKGLGAYDKG